MLRLDIVVVREFVQQMAPCIFLIHEMNCIQLCFGGSNVF